MENYNKMKEQLEELVSDRLKNSIKIEKDFNDLLKKIKVEHNLHLTKQDYEKMKMYEDYMIVRAYQVDVMKENFKNMLEIINYDGFIFQENIYLNIFYDDMQHSNCNEYEKERMIDIIECFFENKNLISNKKHINNNPAFNDVKKFVLQTIEDNMRAYKSVEVYLKAIETKEKNINAMIKLKPSISYNLDATVFDDYYYDLKDIHESASTMAQMKKLYKFINDTTDVIISKKYIEIYAKMLGTQEEQFDNFIIYCNIVENNHQESKITNIIKTIEQNKKIEDMIETTKMDRLNSENIILEEVVTEEEIKEEKETSIKDYVVLDDNYNLFIKMLNNFNLEEVKYMLPTSESAKYYKLKKDLEYLFISEITQINEIICEDNQDKEMKKYLEKILKLELEVEEYFNIQESEEIEVSTNDGKCNLFFAKRTNGETYLKSDIDGLVIEDLAKVKNLLGRFKNSENLSARKLGGNSNTLELKYDDARLMFKHIEDGNYLILGVYIKKMQRSKAIIDSVKKRFKNNAKYYDSLRIEIKRNDNLEKQYLENLKIYEECTFILENNEKTR